MKPKYKTDTIIIMDNVPHRKLSRILSGIYKIWASPPIANWF